MPEVAVLPNTCGMIAVRVFFFVRVDRAKLRVQTHKRSNVPGSL